jgi:hypothetical protein
MRSAPLLAACLLVAALGSFAAAQPAAREGYYVDFRARGGGVLGHTFVVYGRMDANGNLLQENYASLYPDEAYDESPALSVMLVRGYVTAKREDPSKPVRAIFRRKLNAAEYAHLRLTIARLKASQHQWHMWFYNCNDFAAQVAREMGLAVPSPWTFPNTFVHSLWALNTP